jgi:hypothetical protein
MDRSQEPRWGESRDAREKTSVARAPGDGRSRQIGSP